MIVSERSQVVPLLSAPGGHTRLQLTFLDLPWLFFHHPSQRIFFYDYPHPASHFASAALPLLKSSLSLALSLFYPLAGHLHAAPARPPSISCSPSAAGVTLTVAESDDDFHDLSHNDSRCPRQRAARRFHRLVPALISGEAQAQHAAPHLMAVQVTVFPGSGFSVGIAYQHVAADERTFNNFVKAWASFCTAVTGQYHGPTPMIDPPHYDRAVIREMPALEQKFLHEWWKLQQQQQQHRYSPLIIALRGNKVPPARLDDSAVRSTFVVGPDRMELVRSWITRHCEANGLPLPVHLSPYVLTCALLWVVRVRTHVHLHLSGTRKDERKNDATSYFGFVAGGISRVGYPVPGSYFGNCVGFGRAEAATGELLGEGGIFHAASAIGSTIKRLDRSMLEGASFWVSDWRAMLESDLHVMVAGSPKVDFYETNFGWGRPRKMEEVSIDWTGAISLHESRDVEGAMEAGLSLPRVKMDAFCALFRECLANLKR